MKRAVILHAMEQNSQGHWYPWLKSQLETRGYEVWVPDLPHAEHPDTSEMTQFLLSNNIWSFQDNLIIGHSSGSVEVLYLLQALPVDVTVKTAVIVSPFDHPLPGMEQQHDRIFLTPLDLNRVQTRTEKFIFVHGDDDPWCPLDGAASLARQTDGELVVVPGGKHFSTSLDPAYTTFPKLLEILDERGRL